MSNTISKKTWWLIGLICATKLAIHLWANGNYGFHRDELLHIACGDHLAWGYMEFPPFIGWMAALQRTLLGDSVLAIRLLPALLGTTIVLFSALAAKALGGNGRAMIVAALVTFGAHAYWRNHTLFQPVVFDQFFWTLGFLLLIWYLNTQQRHYLLALGVVAGLGLLNKYTMLFWGAGLGIGILLSPQRWLLQKRDLWLALGIALLLFAPNIWWQAQHDFPFLEHASGLYDRHFDSSRWTIVNDQFWDMNPFALPFWLGGALFLLGSPKMANYRVLGITFFATFTLFLITNAKSYYLFALYPIFFAAGGVAFAKIVPPKWQWVIAIYLFCLLGRALVALPHVTPLLPIQSFAQYAGLDYDQTGRLQGLTGDYADMFGWEEQVQLVDSLYQSLSPEEQEQCVLWAENYGEAGAIQHLGRAYKLPPPLCKHGSFWLWEDQHSKAEIAISIGNEPDAVGYFFQDTTLVRMIQHPYAIDEEHNIPVYLCRSPKVYLKDYWPNYRPYIFD
ncbi:MAG: glycosyltransferase family 39 protein [Bacteroidota bacterium]